MTKKNKKSNFRNKVRRDSERQKSAASSYGYLNLPQGLSVFNPEPGSRVKMDVIPYEVTDENHPDKFEDEQIATPGELWYKRPFKIHRNIGPNNERVVCPTSFGKKCPICEYRAKRIKEGADKDETDALKISHRNLYVIVPKGVKDTDEKPHVMDISWYMFQNLLNQELEENEDNAVFPDLEEGKTLKVRFDSKSIGSGNAFAEASRIDFITRKEQYDESILDKVPNLDKLLNLLSYKDLEVMFMEIDDDDVGDDDPDGDDPDDDITASRRSKHEPDDDDDDPDLEDSPGKDNGDPLEEDDDNDDDDDAFEEDYDWSELNDKQIKKLAKAAGIKTKGKDRDDLEDELEDIDEDDLDDAADEIGIELP